MAAMSNIVYLVAWVSPEYDEWSRITYRNLLLKEELFIGWRKYMTKKMHNIIFNELIEISCHPSRLLQCNEYYCERFPEKYQKECNKWCLK